MTLRDDGEIVSTSDEFDCDDMPPLENASGLKYLVSDKVLVIRRRMMWSNKRRTSSILDA